MSLRSLAMSASVGAVLMMPTVFGHHSLRGYDQSAVVTVKGTISEIKWRNPHTRMTLRVTNPDGTARSTEIEMAGPSALTQRGFSTGSLNVGDAVTFEVWMPLDPKSTILSSGRTLVLADGRRIDVSDPWFSPAGVMAPAPR